MLVDFLSDLPLWLWILIVWNVITFSCMLLDKWFASVRMRRISEKAFFLMTFLGGSIGVLLGMFLFRHKTQKTSFQIVVGVIVLLQIALIVWFLDPML